MPVDPRRHLQSSISEHVPGGVWGSDQGAMRGTAVHRMQKLHEFGFDARAHAVGHAAARYADDL